ncbi:hypothetical protein FSP39_013837 [Pinctada imbricata]|uniref:procollagen-proline 3-dioxygenase n=1 Tax=Pinctada imbricata TaxID=66713 RepID=A0AA88YCK6_PINIB|nr:hypothetical protein FSP39_013837 [Pinctada imbricata]
MQCKLWNFMLLLSFPHQYHVESLVEDPLVTYDALYQVGMDFYRDEKWSRCIAFINKALEDYYFFKENLVKCRLDCKDRYSKSDFSDVFRRKDLLTLKFFGDLILESNCVKRCHKRVFGDRPEEEDRRVTNVVEEDFKRGRPYHFLQFCHYQEGEFSKAASAAYTYFLLNPENQDTIANLQLYRDKVGVKDGDITDMARKPYQAMHIEGDLAYEEGNWTVAIEKLEAALQEFYKEERACRAECEGFFDQGIKLPDFVHALSEHFIKVVQCQYNCGHKLSRIYVDHEEHFVQEHYNFLQFAYYKSNNTEKAVEAAGTYLMFNPRDPDMLRNKVFYVARMGYHDAHFVPRKEAKEYFERREEMARILDYVKTVYRANYTQDADVVDFKEIDNQKKSTKANDHYMKVYEKMGIKLDQDYKGIKGRRFLADGFLREEHCTELVQLANAVQNGKDGCKSLDVPAVIQLVKKNEDLEISLRLFLKTCEMARHYTARYFNETSLFVSNARLTCFIPEEMRDRDCMLQETGECIGIKQVSTQADDSSNTKYRSVMYLTENEETDAMVLTDIFKEEEAVVYPACGRLVGFPASDRHYLDSVLKQRCELVLNFTTDRKHEDSDHRKAITFLNEMDESRISHKEVDNTEFMKKAAEEGIQITMNGSVLHGDARFVADGLLKPEECKTLIELAKVGAVSGDGYKSGGQAGDGYSNKEEYKGEISPHTKYEIFEGLSINRASKLAYVEAINKKWAELYLSASEKGRLLVEKYFNLTRPIYFDYTHLVCRRAVEGEQDNRTDLSHPVHADNCLIQEDGACLRQFPAYTHRDYSAILYLNDESDFGGGDFFFAHGNTSEQVSVKPKCGRLVGFDSGEFHGVKAVTKGQRCAVALWFTMDPNHREISHIQARNILKKIREPDDGEIREKEDNQDLKKSLPEENLQNTREMREEDVQSKHSQEKEETVKEDTEAESIGISVDRDEARTDMMKGNEEIKKKLILRI